MRTYRRFFVLPILVATSLWAGQASAQNTDINSGNFIMPGCRASQAGSDDVFTLQGICSGAVSAIAHFSGRMPTPTCLPPGVTVGQAVRIVVFPCSWSNLCP